MITRSSRPVRRHHRHLPRGRHVASSGSSLRRILKATERYEEWARATILDSFGECPIVRPASPEHCNVQRNKHTRDNIEGNELEETTLANGMTLDHHTTPNHRSS